MKKGISLLEVLLIIFIIVVLAVIFTPISGFHGGREKARQTACLSNQKQIAMQTLALAEENNGVFPSGSELWATMKGKVLRCPTDSKKLANAYGYNSNLEKKKSDDIREPDTVMLSCDSDGTNNNVIIGPDQIVFRHASGVIASYADGHASYMKDRDVVGFVYADYSFETTKNLPPAVKIARFKDKYSLAVSNFTPITEAKNISDNAAMVENDSGIALKIKSSKNAKYCIAQLDFTEAQSGDFAVRFDWKHNGDISENFIIFGLAGLDNGLVFGLKGSVSITVNEAVNKFKLEFFPVQNEYIVYDKIYDRSDIDGAFLKDFNNIWHFTVIRNKGKVFVNGTNGVLSVNMKHDSVTDDASDLDAAIKGIFFMTGHAGESVEISNIRLVR